MPQDTSSKRAIIKGFWNVRKIAAPVLNIYISWSSHQAQDAFNETSTSANYLRTNRKHALSILSLLY